MSLDFDSTDVVTITAAASINSLPARTALLWVWFDSFMNGGGLFGKGSGATRKQLTCVSAATEWALETRSTVANLKANALIANMPCMATGKWVCLAMVYDFTSGTDVPRIYSGDLQTPLAEPSSYSAQDTLSGTISNDSASTLVLGRNNDGDPTFDGKIAVTLWWNRALTLGELRDQQFRPHVTSGCVLFQHLGWNGTGTQPDWSGSGNSGTVTGATLAAHVPFRPAFGADVAPASSRVIAAVITLPQLERGTRGIHRGMTRGAA